MLLLLAFSSVTAQPLAGRMYGPAGPFPGTPGPYPLAYAPQRSLVIPSQAQFDMYVANQNVRSDRIAEQGHSIFFNSPLSVLVPSTTVPAENQATLLRFGSSAKAAANYVTEQTIQDQIDYFRATHQGPLTQDDRNTLDDLKLQLDAARDQKNRRTAGALPGTVGQFATGAPMSAFFDRRSHESSLTLAENKLVDARRDMAKDPSQQNRIDLMNARDNEEQARDKRDANSFDLMGSSVPYAPVAAPMLRKRASGTQVEIAQRNYRVARLKYVQDPSQDNLDEMRLADLFLQASQDDDDANSKDLLVNSIATKFGAASSASDPLRLWSGVAYNRINDFQSQKWLRYSRLKRQILQRKLAQKASSSSSSSSSSNTAAPAAAAGSVPQRMVALSMYGRPSAVAPRPVLYN